VIVLIGLWLIEHRGSVIPTAVVPSHLDQVDALVGRSAPESSSIIGIVATDAPLLPRGSRVRHLTYTASAEGPSPADPHANKNGDIPIFPPAKPHHHPSGDGVLS